MRYVSTRGASPEAAFHEVMLGGLAPDGGLFLPERWPAVSGLNPDSEYAEVLARCLAPYVGEAISPETLHELASESIEQFPRPEIVPLREIEAGLYLLELFWGPSLAFKDLGLQMLARLFEAMETPVTIVGATSGDTGAAAIQAFRGRKKVVVVILHPDGRISEVQRRQMTTVMEPNVHNVAVEGTFDDCQALAKRLLSDEWLRDEATVASANSINWLRIAAQSAYYAVAALRIGESIDVAVPSGNFGNAFSAYTAQAMGFPVGRVVVATNMNRGLADLLETGSLHVKRAVPTASPAMDIQMPSNLERALLEATGRQPEPVAKAMARLASDAVLTVTDEELANLRGTYRGQAVSENQTTAEIADFHRDHGRLIDPHTAVALSAARRNRDPRRPMVVMGTAHPAKFPETVARASGVVPALPERFAELFELPERVTHALNDYDLVRGLVLDSAGGQDGNR